MAKMILNYRLLWKELVLFSSAQLIGAFSALKLAPLIDNYGMAVEFNFSWPDLVFLFIFIIILFFLFSRFSWIANSIVRFFLILAVFSGSQFIFYSFLPKNLVMLSTLVLVVLFIFWRKVMVHNIAMIFGIAGIGAVFGLNITPIQAIIILSVLSFYDIIAVYWTKHMVKMAEGMIKTKNIFGLIIPEKSGDFISPIDKAQPGQGFMILGSGDIIMPLILSSSVIISSFLSSLIIIGFSVTGMFLTHILFVNQNVRRPMAALPPIAAMSILGYLLTVFLNIV